MREQAIGYKRMDRKHHLIAEINLLPLTPQLSGLLLDMVLGRTQTLGKRNRRLGDSETGAQEEKDSH